MPRGRKKTQTTLKTWFEVTATINNKSQTITFKIAYENEGELWKYLNNNYFGPLPFDLNKIIDITPLTEEEAWP